MVTMRGSPPDEPPHPVDRVDDEPPGAQDATMDSNSSETAFRKARARLLKTMAPKAESKAYPWSGGTTEALVLGKGEPLVLVHGGFSTNLEWVPILQRLARHFRVIAPDRPGCGLASAFDYRSVDVEAHAVRFLQETLDAFGLESARVVGNSMGGRWAIALQSQWPERVEGLILAGAPAGSEGRALPLPLRALRTPGVRQIVKRQAGRGGAKAFRKFASGFIVAQRERMPDVFWDAMAANTRHRMPGWIPFIENVVSLNGRVAPNLNLDGRLGEVTVPTHLIWGNKDAFAGVERGRVVAGQMADATFEEVSGAGHLPWLDEPERVADAILRAARPTPSTPK